MYRLRIFVKWKSASFFCIFLNGITDFGDIPNTSTLIALSQRNINYITYTYLYYDVIIILRKKKMQ